MIVIFFWKQSSNEKTGTFQEVEVSTGINFYLSWLEHVANYTGVMGLMSMWIIHLGAGLDDYCDSLPAQNILCFCEIQTHSSASICKHGRAEDFFPHNVDFHIKCF